MGTRNLTIVIFGGKNVVAQYCQWDGYPDGQGVNALEFLRDVFNRDKFIERLTHTHFVTENELATLQEQVHGFVPADWITMDEADKFAAVHPQLDRDMGARVLEFIQEGQYSRTKATFAGGKFAEKTTLIVAPEEIALKDDSDFGADKLFCEWIWTVDLDRNVFIGTDNGDKTVEWALNALPTPEQFVAAFEDPEEDDDQSGPLMLTGPSDTIAE